MRGPSTPPGSTEADGAGEAVASVDVEVARVASVLCTGCGGSEVSRS